MANGNELSIRRVRMTDCESISPLLAQLGYPTDADEVRTRLARLLAIPEVGVLVGETAGHVVGLASFHMLELLYRPRPQCRITALVVCARHRRQGTGAELVNEIERIARERDCFRIELTTRHERGEALPFYTSLGFMERRRRLVKSLPRVPAARHWGRPGT